MKWWMTVLALISLLMTGCGESGPPEPTPIGQVCETRIVSWMPVYVGKSMSMFPVYATDCWIEEEQG